MLFSPNYYAGGGEGNFYDCCAATATAKEGVFLLIFFNGFTAAGEDVFFLFLNSPLHYATLHV
jgi:hypothetical protein